MDGYICISVCNSMSVKPQQDATIKIRKNRRQSGSFFESFVTSCETNCEAQFQRDFQDSLGKSYDTEFFDFPIDPLISSSREKFQAFCQLVEEKSICYREECDISEPPTTPQTHICIQQRTRFEQALRCLNTTTSHLKCHSACSKAARRSIKEEENRDSETAGFSDQEKRNYNETDLRCRFQACTLECRRQLIGFHCDEDEQETARQTVTLYYSSDLNLDAQEFRLHDSLRLYPKFCRSFLAIETEDANLSNQLQVEGYEVSFNRAMGILRREASRSTTSNKYHNSYF
uniref:Uncharacterized protein n=1 Tax=Ditylenchus dipsaci TaxID=166011 RepID=A0A915EGB0_9BILA